jgi:hypothetical protein
MALPIFVIGRNRSGTTWLANQLCEHPDIVGVQHERHHGIHESAYFGRIDGRYGDLSERINYAEFVEVVSASDFFKLAGATSEFLYSLWPTTYEEVFRRVMDRFAETRGAAAWLEKSDVQVKPVEKVMRAYPDARFVGIVREVVANTASTIANPNAQQRIRSRTWALIRTALAWAYNSKIIRATSRRSDRLMVVRYEDLRRDREGTLRSILDFLGLGWNAAILNQSYAPQSTFRSDADRQKALSQWEEVLIRSVAGIGQILPRPVLGLGDGIRRLRRGRGSLPIWFFRLQPFFRGDPAQYDGTFGHPGSSAHEEGHPAADDRASRSSSQHLDDR